MAETHDGPEPVRFVQSVNNYSTVKEDVKEFGEKVDRFGGGEEPYESLARTVVLESASANSSSAASSAA